MSAINDLFENFKNIFNIMEGLRVYMRNKKSVIEATLENTSLVYGLSFLALAVAVIALVLNLAMCGVRIATKFRKKTCALETPANVHLNPIYQSIETPDISGQLEPIYQSIEELANPGLEPIYQSIERPAIADVHKNPIYESIDMEDNADM